MKRLISISIVTLAILGALNCTVRVDLKAEFSAAPTSGYAPLEVAFTDSSAGAPTSWSWDFGDGATSTDENPTHTYSAGTFDVSLAVSNGSVWDTSSKPGYITVTDTSTFPQAAFTTSPSSGPVPLAVNFTDQSLGSPTSWSWNFGDGHTSTQKNPSNTYTEIGTYSVTLVITNLNGADTLTKSNYITVTDSTPSLQYDSVSVQGFKFKWATDGALLRCVLSAPSTGWVSVGFDPAAMHTNANIIIGFVKQGSAYIQDNFGTSHNTHASDVSLGGSDDVTDKGGRESGGRTEISFAIPLDSGDPYDRKLVSGNTYEVILAHSPNGMDDYTSMHSGVGSASITIR